MTSQRHMVGLHLLVMTLLSARSSLGDNENTVGCPPPSSLPHGSFELDGDDVVIYFCNDGYIYLGEEVLYCENNRWSSFVGLCLITPQPFGHRCYEVNSRRACRTKNGQCVQDGDQRLVCACRPFYEYSQTDNECYLKPPDNVECTIKEIGDSFIVFSATADCSKVTHYNRFFIIVKNPETGVRNYRIWLNCRQTLRNERPTYMTPGQPFVIEVGGLAGTTASNTNRICRSGHTRPSAPRDLSFSYIEADSFIANYGTDSRVDGYRLRIEPGSLDIKIVGDIRGYEVNGLNASTTYTVSVFGLAGESESEPTTKSVCTRPLPPTNVTLIYQTDDSITLDIYPDGDQIVGTSTETEIRTVPMTCDYHCKIEGLRPGHAYNISVYVFDCGHWSGPGSTVKTFTRPAIPTSPATIDVTDSSFCLQWSPPLIGNYDSFEAELRTSDTRVVLQKTEDQMHCFVNLSPGTMYEIFINSVWQGKNSVSPQIVTVTTKPGPPINLKSVDNATETTLCVQWEPPAVGSADKYKLQLLATGVKIQAETNDAIHCFGQLEKDTKYTIIVWTFLRGMISVDQTTIEASTQKDSHLESAFECNRNIAIVHETQLELMKKVDALVELMQAQKPSN